MSPLVREHKAELDRERQNLHGVFSGQLDVQEQGRMRRKEGRKDGEERKSRMGKLGWIGYDQGIVR